MGKSSASCWANGAPPEVQHVERGTEKILVGLRVSARALPLSALTQGKHAWRALQQDPRSTTFLDSRFQDAPIRGCHLRFLLPLMKDFR